MLFARSTSDVELEYIRIVAERAIDIQSKYREDQANRIIKRLAESMAK
jgi:hypothetical protein